MQEVLKAKTTDGEEWTKKCQTLSANSVDAINSWLEETSDSLDKEKDNALKQLSPNLKKFLAPLFKSFGNTPELRLLLKEADSFIYPFLIHVMGNAVMHADDQVVQETIADEAQTWIKRPFIEQVSRALLDDLFAFVNRQDRTQLGVEVAAYEKGVSEIEKAAEKSIQNIKGRFGDVSKPENAAQKVMRDDQILEVKKFRDEQLQELKNPFENLLKTLLPKMGLDEEGLSKILPFFVKDVVGGLKKGATQFCIDYYKGIVVKEGHPPAGAEKMVGYAEGRAYLNEKLDLVKLLKKTPLKDVAQLPEIQIYFKPLIVDVASDLFVNLAASYPPVQGQEKIEMVPNALQHIAKIVLDKYKTSNLEELVAEPEGPAKDKKIKMLFRPIVQEVLAKGGWDTARLPEMVKEGVKGQLEDSLVPKLIYRGVEFWVKLQEKAKVDAKIIKMNTNDGAEIVKKVETLDIAPLIAAIKPDTVVSEVPLIQETFVQLLQAAKEKTAVRTMLEKASSLSFPLLIHLLAGFVENGSGDQPLLNSLVKELRQSVFTLAVSQKLEIAQAFAKLQAAASKEMALQELKNQFKPLVADILKKGRLDPEGLKELVDIDLSFVSETISSKALDFCVDFYQNVIVEPAEPHPAAAKIVGLEKGEEFLKKIDLAKLLEKTPLKDIPNSDIQPIFNNLVTHFLISLAASNPDVKDQEKIEMLPSALGHVAKLISEKLNASQIEKLLAEPENNEAKKAAFQPLFSAILEKGGWATARLPNMGREAAKSYLEDTLLPNLMYKALEHGQKLKKAAEADAALLKARTSDGAEAVKVVETLASQTAPLATALAAKLEEAIQIQGARPKEGPIVDSLALLLRDTLLKNSDQTTQEAVVQLLKAVGGDKAIASLLENGSSVTYPLLIHVLASFTESATAGPKQALLTVVVNNLLQSLFNFADKTKLDEAFKVHAAALQSMPDATPEQLKEAKKPFKSLFEPLVDDIFKKAHLDPDGLTKLIPFEEARKKVSDLLRSEALDFCVDFYEEVIAVQGKEPEVAKSMKGYQQGRTFFTAMVKELMPNIREALEKEENRVDIQKAIVDEVNDRLFKGKLPIDRAGVMQVVKEFVAPDSPYYQNVAAYVEPYIVDVTTDLMAHLSASYAPKTDTDMMERATAHLTEIVNSTKNPETIQKLSNWKALPEGTEEERKAKGKAKLELRKELFLPMSEKLLEKGGWNALENIRAPKVLRQVVKNILERTLLPDQIFRIAVDTLVPKPFSAVDQSRLEKMGGLGEFNILADGIAEKMTPLMFEKMREQEDVIAANINAKLLKESLSVADEAWLGRELDSVLTPGKAEFRPARDLAELFLGQAVRQGLANLALNSPVQTGDIGENVAAYFRDLLETYKTKPALAETVRIYGKQIAPLRELDRQIAELRKRAIKGESVETELTKLKADRKQLEAELNDKYQTKETFKLILQEFQPLVKKVLSDMGYPDAKSLPAPYFLKETVWKNLTDGVLPDLCFTYFEKLIQGYDALIPDVKEVKVYEDKLTSRYLRNHPPLPPGEQAPLVKGVYDLADHIIKQIEAYAALHGADKGLEKLDEIVIPKMYGGAKAEEAVHKVIEQHRKEIGEWIGKESPGLVQIVKDRMGHSLKQLIAAPILKCTSNMLENLEKIEQKNPEALFDFVSASVEMSADHLALATRIAKEQGKAYIHEVDPLIMAREFEKAGKLHPAMPSYTQLKALSDLDKHIGQLEAQVKEVQKQGSAYVWHLHVDQLKKEKQVNFGPQYFLDAARTDREAIRKQIEEKRVKNFYEGFSQSLLKLGGVNGPQDLPGGEEFWNLLRMTKEKSWELFKKETSPLLMKGLETALSPQQMNSYFAKILTSLNENLTAKQAKGELQLSAAPPSDAKVDLMEERCQKLIKVMYKVLPGTIIQELRMLPLINKIPGTVLAQSLKEVLQKHPLSQLIEENLADAIGKLPKELPTTFGQEEAAKKRNLKENEANIAAIRAEAEKTVPNIIKSWENNFINKWKKTQDAIDSWISKVFGKKGGSVKAFLDRVFHAIFITALAKPLYKGLRWLLSLVIAAYGRRVGTFAELGRQSLVTPAINANLLFNMGAKFQEIYKLP